MPSYVAELLKKHCNLYYEEIIFKGGLRNEKFGILFGGVNFVADYDVINIHNVDKKINNLHQRLWGRFY